VVAHVAAVMAGAVAVLHVLAVRLAVVMHGVVLAVDVHMPVVHRAPVVVAGLAGVVQVPAFMLAVRDVGAVPVLRAFQLSHAPSLVQPVCLVASPQVLGLV
jgi:hypothetical protein